MCLSIEISFFPYICTKKTKNVYSFPLFHKFVNHFFELITIKSSSELCPLIMYKLIVLLVSVCYLKDRRDRDRMVVGFTTTYAISDYHH